MNSEGAGEEFFPVVHLTPLRRESMSGRVVSSSLLWIVSLVSYANRRIQQIKIYYLLLFMQHFPSSYKKTAARIQK